MKQAEKITLPNGLRLILVPRPSSFAASVLILVEAGSEYEKKATNGISHFLEHMTFKGTVNRPRPGMIAEELASLGAQSNAFTTHEFTGYWAKADARKLPQILEIVSDLYLHPIFAEEEIEKERGVIIEELHMYEDTPTQKVQDLFLSALYGDQPAGWDIIGTKENIRRFARDEFIAYRDERYAPRGTVIVVAGKMDERAVVETVKRSFGALKRRPLLRKTPTRDRQARPQALVKFKESDQSHLVLGFRAFDLFDKRRYALRVLADVLGGGMSSRLFKKIREELGAAYYIDAGTELFLDHGVFAISAGIDHAKFAIVLTAMLDECRRLARDLVPEAELRRSKDHMIGNFLLGLETADELASFYGGQAILQKTLLPPEKIVARIKETGAEEVRRVARAIFKNNGLNLAAIGPYRNRRAFQNILTI